MSNSAPIDPLLRNIEFSYKGKDYVIEDFNIRNSKASHNLLTLFERTKGTTFRVDKEGHLVKIERFEEWLYYKWNIQEERAKVREVIDRALEYFNDFLAQYKDIKVAEAAAKFLFDREGECGIGRLGKSLYNHKIWKVDNLLSTFLLPTNTIRLKLSREKFVDLTFTKQKIHSHILELKLDEIIDGNGTNNDVLKHNLWMLLKRKKGQIYHVNKKGKLKKVKSLDYFRIQETINLRIQSVVASSIKQLDKYFSKIEMTAVHQLVIKKIFFAENPLLQDNPICRLSGEVFNRGEAIEECSFLESILAPELKEKREKLTKALIALRDCRKEKGDLHCAKLHLEKVFMELVIAECEFSKQLGIDLKRISSGGSGGARFGMDRNGKIILVFKPEDEGPLGVNNPQWYAKIKRLLFSPKPCLEGNSEPEAEFDSWLFDRHFERWTVPPTTICYVASRDFVGNPLKKCSVQMFAADCQTLGEYVGISPKIQWLPRWYLRWFCGSRYDTGPFFSVGQRDKKKKELLEKIPKSLIERASTQNFATEDIDGHFENFLIKISKISDEQTLLDKIFRGNNTLSDKEIENFVQSFFKTKGNQELLEHLLYSEEIIIDGEEKNIFIIKHDGGASNPKKHPSFWDILSLRNNYLFEVFPHFEDVFSEEAKALILNKEDEFCHFLLDKGIGNLRNILSESEGVFKIFFSEESNRMHFMQWVYEDDPEEEYFLRFDLVAALLKATIKAAKKREEEEAQKNDPDNVGKLVRKAQRRILRQTSYFETYFNYHLKRIKGNLQTRIDSYRVLRKYLKSENHMMRAVFKDVRTSEEFKSELKNLDDGFEKTLVRHKTKQVFHEGNLIQVWGAVS